MAMGLCTWVYLGSSLLFRGRKQHSTEKTAVCLVYIGTGIHAYSVPNHDIGLASAALVGGFCGLLAGIQFYRGYQY
jgi:hypothetical protein